MDNNEDYNQVDESEESFLCFGSFLNAVEKWKDYKLDLSAAYPNGYCWYAKSPAPKIDGLTYKGIRTQFLIPVNLEDMDEIANAAKKDSSISDEMRKFAAPVLYMGSWEERSKMAKAIRSYLLLQNSVQHKVQTRHSTQLSVTKPAEVSSFIPEIEQFPKQLLDLNLKREDFLQWLYGPGEIDLMSLHVGRIGYLPQGAIAAGETEPVKHSYRSMIILKSKPDFGKSQFKNWLAEGLESLGLRSVLVRSLKRQFGHGTWVGSAMSYMDDTTNEDLAEILNSAMIKSVCSNEIVEAESKGKDPILLKAMSATLILANNTNTQLFAKCDDGNANRVKVLTCLEEETARLKARQLKPDSVLYGIGILNPPTIIEFLCEKAGVSREILAAYFLRLCVDYFEGFTREGMREKIILASNALLFQFQSSPLNTLVRTGVLAYILKNDINTPDQIASLRARFSGAGNSAALLLDCMTDLAELTAKIDADACGKLKWLVRKHWADNGEKPVHPWRVFRLYSEFELCRLGVRASYQKSQLAHSGQNMVSLDSIYAATFKDLKDREGNPTQYSVSTLESALSEALSQGMTSLQEIYNFIVKEDEEALEAFIVAKPNYHVLAAELAKPDSAVNLRIGNEEYSTVKVTKKSRREIFDFRPENFAASGNLR